jgi:hypothetical protein
VVPLAEMLGVVPEYGNGFALCDDGVVASLALAIGKALSVSPTAP